MFRSNENPGGWRRRTDSNLPSPSSSSSILCVFVVHGQPHFLRHWIWYKGGLLTTTALMLQGFYAALPLLNNDSSYLFWDGITYPSSVSTNNAVTNSYWSVTICFLNELSDLRFIMSNNETCSSQTVKADIFQPAIHCYRSCKSIKNTTQ